MATSITFNGTDLQTEYIVTRQVLHESMDHMVLNIQGLANRDGGVFLEETFTPRVITMSGRIKGDSKSDLESRIDAFKQALNEKEKNLLIEYENGTRRFVASASRITIDRDFYNVTFAPFEVEFVCSSTPFGQSLDTLTIEYSAVNATIGTWITNATFAGTRRPLPTIQLTVNSETNLSSISFTNTTTGNQITVQPSGGYSASDVLIIDTSDFTVSINGSATDYSGVIPEFVQGGNDFRVGFSGDNWNVTMKLIYYSLFL